MDKYIAHITEKSRKKQTVIEHLENTAELASGYAESFGASEEAYRCGILHDIGKYSEEFQRRINGSKERVDHSTAGAAEAFKAKDVCAAFCIAGHHGGIPDRGNRADFDKTLLARVRKKPGEEIPDYTEFQTEVKIPDAKIPAEFMRSSEDAFFFTHMLYSCLVDADWLDTENFMSEGSVLRGTGDDFSVLLEKLDKYISKWWKSEKPINIRRCKILRELIEKGENEKGLYSLTVPTGGGKTVSSMAYALRHAIKNKQRRIIYVIPYTSIIEQTQSVFEDFFGAENVVAHYADVRYNTDESGKMTGRDRLRYLASENWDAPIILTTAVQFFESLFGNHPSQCRKLHNIAESVIIFDEAQMLPVKFLIPCVWSICELVDKYGCTAVLCTATQPSLGKIISEFRETGAKELCSDISADYEFFRRVKYIKEGILSDEELAERISSEKQALCVVNSRDQAQTLFNLISEEGSFHLSTTMVPAHRREVLDEIRRRLRNEETCRVISTSLIEAGVDVDFPTVYRSLAGLDSIIQSGGRCNRENKMQSGFGTVHIFETETKPPKAMEQNIKVARRVLETFDDIDSPEAVEEYFSFLYYIVKDNASLDSKDIMKLIKEDMAFETVSKEFCIISNDDVTVYIPYKKGKELIGKLLSGESGKSLYRELGQYSVSLRKKLFNSLDNAGAVTMVSENTAVLINMDYYNENTGISLSPENGNSLFDI